MGHHEDGGLQGLLGLFEGPDHRPAGLAVQVAGGLVRQDQQGVVDEGPGHGTALLLAAGDLRRVLVPDGGDAEHVAQLVRPGLRLGGDGAADDGGQQDVLPDRQAVQQQEILEHEAQLPVADLGQGVLAEVGQLPVSQSDLPAVDGDVAGDAVEQRGLAGAGGAHDGHELPLLHGQGHALQDLVGGLAHLIGFVQVFNG